VEARKSVALILTTSGRTARPRFRSIIAKVAVVAAASTGFIGVLPDAARAQVPTIDIQETCRMAATVTVGLERSASAPSNDMDICLKSEDTARQQMIKDWSTFESSDRKDCIQPRVYLPSYVEWLTCFEMNRIVRQLRQQGQAGQGLPGVNPDGSYTLPTLRSLGINVGSF
jgi:hypothetical protein